MTSTTEDPALLVEQQREEEEEEEDYERQTPKRTSSLDGSLHIPSAHRGGKRPNPVEMSHSQREGADPGSAHHHHHHVGGEGTANTVEEPRTIEGHSATELTDDIDLINIRDDDDEDGDSFCDADDTSSPDINCLRREMSVTRDDLEDFIVEFGDEIAEAANAYYDDQDGDKIAVPRTHVVPIEEEEKERGENQNGNDATGQDDHERETNKED